MAVADYFRLADRFAPLENFGIACTGEVKSVLLFARRPIESLEGGTIGLTNESSTSVRLLQILMERKHGCKHVRFHRGEEAEDDARLLIGDAALRARKTGLPGYEHVADLGTEWHAWTGMPFTFARWVVARDVPQGDRDRIAQSVRSSVDGWRRRVGEIAARRGPELDMDEREIEEYLATFAYRLGPAEEAAERRFAELLFAVEELE
jgi:chorismate dehydratase